MEFIHGHSLRKKKKIEEIFSNLHSTLSDTVYSDVQTMRYAYYHVNVFVFVFVRAESTTIQVRMHHSDNHFVDNTVEKKNVFSSSIFYSSVFMS